MPELPRKATGVARAASRVGESGEGAMKAATRDERGALHPSPSLLRFAAVRARTGLSRSTIRRLERRGQFPPHYQIAPNVVAWVDSDITRWIELRTSLSVAS